MNKRSSRYRWSTKGVGFLACTLSIWAISDSRSANAQAPSNGSYSAILERSWPVRDLRLAPSKEVVAAYLKLSLICGYRIDNSILSGIALNTINRKGLEPIEATMFSCALGAPSTATCEQVLRCSGASKVPAPGSPNCDGGFLNVILTKDKSSAGISCPTFGSECYHNSYINFCGEEPCSPGETYSCDGHALIACVHGVRVRKPCGEGMTCGPTAGSGVLDCIGAGDYCDKGDVCKDGKLHRCVKDSFKKGNYRVIDCQAQGFECALQTDKLGIDHGVCSIPKLPECSVKQDAIHCEQGGLNSCVAGRWLSVSCGELGLTGSCHESSGTFSCGQ
jgi:hypothetical protein